MTWFPHELSWTVWIWPAALTSVSAFLWYVTLRIAPEIRVPLLVYGGFYILTTLIGAAIIGVTEGDVLLQLEYGLDVKPLSGVGSSAYWLMLYAPLLVPVGMFLLLRDAKLIDEALLSVIPHHNTTIKTTGFLSIFGLFAVYCLARLAWSGNLLAITHWYSSQSDYLAMIAVRYELGEQLGSAFFGIIYIALPTLSFVALHQAVQTRAFAWKLLTVFAIGVVSFISLSLMQKSPFILYLAFLNLALLDLKVVTLKVFAISAALVILSLTALQTMMLESWELHHSINLILFRMASSFPYYQSVYPELVPFAGIESGLHLVGLGAAATDNHTIFNFMYPDVKTQGAAAAPAHLRAYCQAGYLYALVTLAIISIPLKASTLAYRHRQSPFAFAIYMGLLIQLYYVMQTSLREALISCYGIFWVIVAVCCVMLVAHRKTAATRQQPTRPAMPPLRKPLPARSW